MVRDMTNSVTRVLRNTVPGGAPGEQLVRCNRCDGTGIARGVSARGHWSGKCYACKGTGVLAASRAAAYVQAVALQGKAVETQLSLPLAQTQQAIAAPATPLPGSEFPGAAEYASRLRSMGWLVQQSVLDYGVETLARHKDYKGKTLHLTHPTEGGCIREWLEGSPSKHKAILQGEA